MFNPFETLQHGRVFVENTSANEYLGMSYFIYLNDNGYRDICFVFGEDMSCKIKVSEFSEAFSYVDDLILLVVYQSPDTNTTTAIFRVVSEKYALPDIGSLTDYLNVTEADLAKDYQAIVRKKEEILRDTGVSAEILSYDVACEMAESAIQKFFSEYKETESRVITLLS